MPPKPPAAGWLQKVNHWHQWAANGARVIGQTVRSSPIVLLIPLIVLSIGMAAGVVAVLAVNHVLKRSKEEASEAYAHALADTYQLMFQSYAAAAVALRTAISMSPAWPNCTDVLQPIYSMMTEHTKQPNLVVRYLSVAPFARVGAVYPTPVSGDYTTGPYSTVGFDYLTSPNYTAFTENIISNGLQDISAHKAGTNGSIIIVVREPIYIAGVGPNETFGVPWGPAGCLACYNATKQKMFWGLAIAVAELMDPVAALRLLEQDTSYHFSFTQVSLLDAQATEMFSTQGLDNPRRVNVTWKLPNPTVSYYISIQPANGWSEKWVMPLISLVVVLSVGVACMQFAMQLSRRQHQMLLSSMLPKNMLDRLRAHGTFLSDKGLIESGTTADKVLGIMSELLEGRMPPVEDVVMVRTAILQSWDIYQPIGLEKQLEASDMDQDVMHDMMRLLGNVKGKVMTAIANTAAAARQRRLSYGPMSALTSATQSFSDLRDVAQGAYNSPRAADPFTSLASALQLIMAGPAEQARITAGHGATPVLMQQGSTRPSLTGMTPTNMSGVHGTVLGGTPNGPTYMAQPGPSNGLDLDDMGGVTSAEGCLAEHNALLRSNSVDGGSAVPGIDKRDSGLGAVVGPPAVCDKAGSGSTGVGSGMLNSVFSTLSTRVRTGSNLGPHVQGSSWAPVSPSVASQDKLLKHMSVSRELPTITPRASSTSPALQAPAHQLYASHTGQGVAVVVNPAPPLMDEVEMVLMGVDMFEFDAFKLDEATRGHPLSTLAYFLLHETRLIDKFRLRKPALARYLRAVEAGYGDNPYHNRIHAADVLQTLHAITIHSGLMPNYADPLSQLACYLAAVVHDFEHGGLTNDFLVNSANDLALIYNDKAPLENHHVASSCILMRNPEHNFVHHLSREEQDKLRRMIIELVLGTDMKQHFAIVSHFSTVHRLQSGGGPGSAATMLAHAEAASKQRRRQLNHQTSRAGNEGSSVSNGNAATNGNADACPPLVPVDDTEKMLSLQMALKCADIGHIAESLPVHLKWVSRLEEEFFRQGDREKGMGMPVSPLFDRQKPGITKSQQGFFDFVVVPLFVNFASVFNIQPMLELVLHNYKHWQGDAEKDKPPAETALTVEDDDTLKEMQGGNSRGAGGQLNTLGSKFAASVKRMSLDLRR